MKQTEGNMDNCEILNLNFYVLKLSSVPKTTLV